MLPLQSVEKAARSRGAAALGGIVALDWLAICRGSCGGCTVGVLLSAFVVGLAIGRAFPLSRSLPPRLLARGVISCGPRLLFGSLCLCHVRVSPEAHVATSARGIPDRRAMQIEFWTATRRFSSEH
jgi:hypothetical protein